MKLRFGLLLLCLAPIVLADQGKEFDQFPNKPKKAGYFVDFDKSADLTRFTGTAISSGTATVVDGTLNGLLRLSGAATTSASGYQVQNDRANVGLTTSKRTRIQFSVSLSDATNSALLIGVAATDTSLIASAPSDGIYIRKDNGDLLMDCVVRSGSAEVAVTTGAYTLADATTVNIAIDIQMTSTANKGTVTYYVNGTSVATLTNSTLPSAVMAASAAFQSGNASGTKTIDIDYLGVDQDR